MADQSTWGPVYPKAKRIRSAPRISKQPVETHLHTDLMVSPPNPATHCINCPTLFKDITLVLLPSTSFPTSPCPCPSPSFSQNPTSQTIPHKTTETEIETETETQNRRLFKSERNGAFPSDCVNKGGRKPTRVSDIVVRAVELVFRL